jgi:two-component sensor histidine kinase
VDILALGQTITRQDADSMIRALNKSKQDIYHIDLLLHLAQFHIFKPGEEKIDLDSAMVYIKDASVLNKTLKSSAADGYQLLTESYLVKEKGQKVDGRKMAEKAVRILEAANNGYYLGRACYELSMYFGYEELKERLQKIAMVERAVNAFKQAGTLERNAYSLEMLGDLYAMIDKFPKAIQVLHQALAAYESIKHPKLQGVYILLGQAYQYDNNESQALFYMLKALQTAHLVHDTSMQLCQINNILGALYKRIDRKEMSVKYLSDALEIAKRNRNEDAIFLLATNMSATYNSLDQPDKAMKVLAFIPEKFRQSSDPWVRAYMGMLYLETYTRLKQYGKAEAYCDTVLKLANNEKIGDQTRYNVYFRASTYYIDTKQYAQARYYLTKNIEMWKGREVAAFKMEDSRLWYKLDSVQGNFRAAFNHLHFYKTKMDSLFSVNRVKQLQVLSIEFETVMKEDSIKLKDKDISILTQKNNLQQANLQKASLIKNVTIGGIILAVIIIGLLYRQYRNKQTTNKVITQKNEQLQHYLTEKEWLLKEIHHRVKNNLQIVMSLLNSQSAYIDNESALTAIHDSQHRVHAMSLIHQKLYGTDNVSSIDMPSYIRELASYLRDSFDTGQRIHFEFDITPLVLDVSQSVPLGLILNEAITNSIKYAFPQDRDGVIIISLSSASLHHYLLSISDNGVGMPSQTKGKKKGSLGMSLMAGLAEDLEGNLSIENNNGTTIKVSFVHHIETKRSAPLLSSSVTAS